MAANYWDSTQAKYWTFTKSELAELRKQLADANQLIYTKHPLPDRRLLNIYLQQNLVRLAKRMSLRQQALATAQVYMKRFYLRVEMRKTNPYLIMTTAVYLACKVEECPQHIRLMLGEAARQWPELNVNESSKIGECEFAMISTLNSRLIVHHPYRSLTELAPLFALSGEEVALAHSIINDSYATDLALVNPPHVIAIAAIFLAVVLRPTTTTTAATTNQQQAPPPSFASAASSSSPTASSPLASPGGHPGFSASAAAAASAGSPTISASAAQNALMGGLQASLKQVGPKLGKLVDWLAESKVDMNALVDATQELISLYEAWEQQYSERACKEAITKFMQGIVK